MLSIQILHRVYTRRQHERKGLCLLCTLFKRAPLRSTGVCTGIWHCSGIAYSGRCSVTVIEGTNPRRSTVVLHYVGHGYSFTDQLWPHRAQTQNNAEGEGGGGKDQEGRWRVEDERVLREVVFRVTYMVERNDRQFAA